MAKNTVKTYQKFKGINQKDSPLLSNMSEFSNCENYVYNGAFGSSGTPDNVSLIGRVGSQVVSPIGNFYDLIKYTYNYEDTTKVRGLDKLYAIGNGMFELQKKSITITYVNTASAGDKITFLLDPVSQTYKFKIYQANAEVFSQDVGTGLENTGLVVKLYDLMAAVDALGSYSVNLSTSFPNFSKINGTFSSATSPTTSSTFNVDAGHNITAGSVILLSADTGVSYTRRIYPAFVLSTTGTSITVCGYTNVVDNEYTGTANFPAACILQTETNFQTVLTYSTATIYFYDLVPVFTHFDYKATGLSYDNQGLQHLYNNKCSSVNIQDVIYFTYPVEGKGSDDTTKVRKYDGLNCYAAGVPKIDLTAGAVGAAGSIADGTYLYTAFYKFVDNKGNILEGAQSDPITVTVSGKGGLGSVPLTASSIKTAFGALSINTNTANFPNIKNGTLTANIVGANTITISTVNSSCPHFVVGDKISFNDRGHAFYPVADSFTTRNVTAVNYTTNTVTFDGSPVTLNIGDFVSCGLSILIYRTKAGGLDYYLETEVPCPPSAYVSVSLYTSGLQDARLEGRLVEEISGQERGIIPSLDIIGVHQGLLIGSRGNTIYYSLLQQPESFPADNYIEFEGTGEITGFISDTDDRLLVFKKKSIFKVEGDISSGNYVTTKIRDGDFGVSSHASLRKINGYIIGLGEMGFIALSDGALLLNNEGDSLIGSYINPEIRKKLYELEILNLSSSYSTNFNHASAFNNSLDGQYECYIPDTLQNYTGNVYCLNYLNGGSWLKNTYSLEAVTPNCFNDLSTDNLFYIGKKDINGMYFAQSQIYLRNYKINGFSLDTSGSLPEKYKYADNHLVINNKLKTRDEHLGFPSVFKEFIWFKIFSMYPFLDFDLLVTTYLNFVGHSYGDPSFTLTFSSNTSDLDRFHDYHKLSLNKAFAIAFEIENNTIHTCPVISGLELVVSPSYVEEEPYS